MEALTSLPLSALRESPFNPRKSYPEEPLRELAESIATQGLLQPIVVRPVDHTDADEVRYEVVFGHRRLRASHMAKQLTIPAIVRAFTDAEALVAQIHENAKREDINAIEEADGLARLQREMGMAPGEIAAEVGRSLSSVYNSLKLAKADESLRRAVLEQKLPPQVAYEVARLPWQLQAKALEDLRDADGEWFSYRDAKAALRCMFQSLDAAPFPVDVEGLLPNISSCTACLKRSGNEPSCADLDPMLCLDMDCFAKKKAAALAGRVAKLRDIGETVLEGDSAKKAWPSSWNAPPGLVRIEANGYMAGTEPVTLQQLIDRLPKKEPKPAPVHIVSPHDGKLHTFIQRQDANDLVARMSPKQRATTGDQTSLVGDDDEGGEDQTINAGRPDPLADWTPAERVTREQQAWDKVVKATLVAICSLPRTTDDMRLWLLREYTLDGSFDDAIEAHFGLDAAKEAAQKADDEAEVEFEEHLFIQAWLQQQTADTLASMVTAITALETLQDLSPSRGPAARKVAMAERYGVDVLKAAGIEPEPQAPAKPAVKVPKGVKYRDPATGSTWTGKGLQPRWLKVAIEDGAKLEDFAV